MSNQVTTTIAIDLENRNRATVFWRGIIVLPVLIFVTSFTPNAFSDDSAVAMGATGFIVLPTVLAILFRSIYPSYVLSFNHALVELETRLFAYILLLNDDYPSIELMQFFQAGQHQRQAFVPVTSSLNSMDAQSPLQKSSLSLSVRRMLAIRLSLSTSVQVSHLQLLSH